MSYLLPHLHSGWAIDQAILSEEERLLVIRFGHGWDETCIQVDIHTMGVFDNWLLHDVDIPTIDVYKSMLLKPGKMVVLWQFSECFV
ncbi:hypothetical protein Ddye_025524 [Dipteronia dyeriana]|uniref:Thioredoxin-like protein 4A n=1 Tax=Dipteronia dyeriana TaxID=168575 RepID=A0AAD9TLC2_9ROSI|nr:hypothetical protein Ddye_025524 [Dipteronia dyeriana]